MILYIIRHADPDYENNTITEFGWQEAHALADWLKDIRLDRIYTSPLGRAIDTAKPTCAAKGMQSEILPWTVESMDYMQSHVMKPDSQCSYRYSVQNGVYDFEDFYPEERMKTIEEMIRCSDEFLAGEGYARHGAFYSVTKQSDARIAVFCHGGFGGAWISHLLGTAPGMMYPVIRLGTSSVTMFEFSGETGAEIRPMLRRLGELHHIYKAGLRINDR